MRKEIKKAALTISRLVPTLMSGVELKFFSKTNITSSQLITIMTINSLKKCSMGKLARNLYVTMPTVTGVINRLVKQRLVERSVSEKDRRKVFIGLTPKGASLIRDVRSIIHRRWSRLLSALSPKEIEAFQRIMQKLHDYIKEQRAKDEK